MIHNLAADRQLFTAKTRYLQSPINTFSLRQTSEHPHFVFVINCEQAALLMPLQLFG